MHPSTRIVMNLRHHVLTQDVLRRGLARLADPDDHHGMDGSIRGTRGSHAILHVSFRLFSMAIQIHPSRDPFELHWREAARQFARMVLDRAEWANGFTHTPHHAELRSATNAIAEILRTRGFDVSDTARLYPDQLVLDDLSRDPFARIGDRKVELDSDLLDIARRAPRIIWCRDDGGSRKFALRFGIEPVRLVDETATPIDIMRDLARHAGPERLALAA